MAWFDVFSSKEDVAQELAIYEVAQSPIGENATSEQIEELEKCSTMYLVDSYSKRDIVHILDTKHR